MEPADSALPRVYGQTVESSGQSWDGFLTFVFSSTGLESMWCLWSYGRRETIPLYLLKASKNLASNLKYFCLTPQTWVGSCSRFHFTWLCLFSHLQCLLPRLLCFLFVQAFCACARCFSITIFSSPVRLSLSSFRAGVLSLSSSSSFVSRVFSVVVSSDGEDSCVARVCFGDL